MLAAAFPGITFNAKVYDEMLGDLDDKYFLKAVYEFIQTTKEVYPGTNPIAILREKAVGFIPCLPKPKRTEAEMKVIADMEDFYQRAYKEANDPQKQEELKPKPKRKILGRTPSECIAILKARGEI